MGDGGDGGGRGGKIVLELTSVSPSVDIWRRSFGSGPGAVGALRDAADPTEFVASSRLTESPLSSRRPAEACHEASFASSSAVTAASSDARAADDCLSWVLVRSCRKNFSYLQTTPVTVAEFSLSNRVSGSDGVHFGCWRCGKQLAHDEAVDVHSQVARTKAAPKAHKHLFCAGDGCFAKHLGGGGSPDRDCRRSLDFEAERGVWRRRRRRRGGRRRG